MSKQTDPDTPTLQALWALDPDIMHLNHGSFGACPRAVLDSQTALRAEMEAEAITFLARHLETRLDQARAQLGAFLGAAPQDLAPVSNATTGVNTVLRSLKLEANDELIITDHGYNACSNAARFAADRAGARVIVARVPFPLASPDEAHAAILDCASDRTRLAIIDHVTSNTAMILPIAEIVRDLQQRGIDCLVDGAHAPGILPLDLDALGAAYYTGNCHKWLCAPKGAGFLHVRADRQQRVRPLAISHAANSPRRNRSRFLMEFDWCGTWDPTAFLAVPVALEFVNNLLPGGIEQLMARNRDLALAARQLLCERLGIEPPCPAEMIGAMAAVQLPDGDDPEWQDPRRPTLSGISDLQDQLLERFGIEVPIFPWPAAPRRFLRISAQAYNQISEYEALADTLGKLL
ncbi:MAG: aminotransferase class V-fold PLP-dependent enzyme [Phycisphaerae bacterium]|nr:aminotransferase class V-fold PLP-dependent enzyme [Phycisphaerae bacterium]